MNAQVALVKLLTGFAKFNIPFHNRTWLGGEGINFDFAFFFRHNVQLNNALRKNEMGERENKEGELREVKRKETGTCLWHCAKSLLWLWEILYTGYKHDKCSVSCGALLNTDYNNVCLQNVYLINHHIKYVFHLPLLIHN